MDHLPFTRATNNLFENLEELLAAAELDGDLCSL